VYTYFKNIKSKIKGEKMRSKKDAFVIISVFRNNKPLFENIDNTAKAVTHLQSFGLKTKIVDGVYKGDSEKSILVPIINQNFDLSTVKQLASIYDQESILFVDSDRNAKLIFLKNSLGNQNLGKFISVPKGIAIQVENYTFDGKDHYICDLRGI